jgi:hypothetical protein
VVKRVIGFGVGGSVMRVMLRRVGLEAHMFLGECVENVSVSWGSASILCWGFAQKFGSWLRLDCRVLTGRLR